jgi:membrane peptidoglycan carboxypeptidase
MSASLRLHVDPPRPKATKVDVRVRDDCRFLGAPLAADLDRFRRVFRHRVPGGNEETLIFETGPGSPHWTPLFRVSPFLVHAVLAHEDATFFQHRGFAPHAFEGALARNLEEGRFAYGASTISMQLARNLFLARDKTLARKLKEALLTWWLEKNLTKEEILELYLNVIEFGPRTYGVGPAARHYFGRRPEELSPAESAFLAVLLPSPSAYERQYEQGRISSYALNRIEGLLVHMERKGRIDLDALAYGLDELPRLRFHYGYASAPVRRDFMGQAAPLPVLAASGEPTAPEP